MKIVHLANTDFEFELVQSDEKSIEQTWQKYPLCLQLQYLPLLYAEPDEAIAVTKVPDPQFLDSLIQLGLWDHASMPSFVPLDYSFSSSVPCLSWGFSKRVQSWAHKQGLNYLMPQWEIIKTINSKAFSASCLSGFATLLFSEKDLRIWLEKKQGLFVIKTCFGVSGKGHYFVTDSISFEEILKFCSKEWSKNLPVIGEPWLDRFLDFSTQWNIRINGDIVCVGATIFKSDEKGVYRGTITGPEKTVFKDHEYFLNLHKNIVSPVLEKIQKMGFFGPLGIDAFLYRDEKQVVQLQPLVEINGRQTMSLAALRFQKRWYPNQMLSFEFNQNCASTSLLPTKIYKGNKEMTTSKKLTFSIISDRV